MPKGLPLGLALIIASLVGILFLFWPTGTCSTSAATGRTSSDGITRCEEGDSLFSRSLGIEIREGVEKVLAGSLVVVVTGGMIVLTAVTLARNS